MDSITCIGESLGRYRVAGSTTADRKLRARLSHRVATLRNSLTLPKKCFMRLRFALASQSSGRCSVRLDLEGMRAAAPASWTRLRIALVS